MISTVDWVRALGYSVESAAPSIAGHIELYPRSAQDIAIRSIILQGVVAVAFHVVPEPVIEWFHEQKIWEAVSPQEKAFLFDHKRSDKQCAQFQWRQEAEWALLWMIGKVEALGLPTHQCDTRRLVDDIIPALGANINDFVAAAGLRSPGVLCAEDLRTYGLWCALSSARRKNNPLPVDLNSDVLYE